MMNTDILTSGQPASLSGNAASYQSGGKRHRKFAKKTHKKRIANKGKRMSNTKKCWWKFW